MAKFFYANTWHPELISKVNGDKTKLRTVDYDGKRWLFVPRNEVSWIILPNEGIGNFYISFEYALPPFSTEFWRSDKDITTQLWGLALGASYFSVAGNTRNGTGNDITASLMYIERKAQINGGAGEEIRKDFKNSTGVWPTSIGESGGMGGLASRIGQSSCKFLCKFTQNSYDNTISYTTSFGAGASTTTLGSPKAIYFYMAGIFIRNIIISEEPISFSDTIREVTVDSITGSGWYTSNGKSYTENVNAPATVKLNSASLAEAKRAIEARKFAFSGVSNRQGERINALEVKRANEAHQSLVDMGEHTFGSSWNVNSPSEITDTLTITSRKVVGK